MIIIFLWIMVVTKTASGVKVAAGGGNGNGNCTSNGVARRTPTTGPSDGARPPQTVAKDKSDVSAGKEKSALLTNKCILRTITAFLASNKRNSYNAQIRAKQTNRRRRQRKMDELSGKINPKLLENLRKKTKFTKAEIDALCRIYRKLISNCQYSAKALATGSSSAAIVKPHATVEGIDRVVFRELLHSTFDIVTEEILMERLFCCWDRAHVGLPLRLEGWLTGLSIFLRGSLAERANFCFRIYDLNSDGFITKDEMFTLLRNCLIKQPQDEDPDEGVKDLVEIVLKKFDLDKDGKVSIEDFMSTLEAEPLLLQAFGQCLPSETATVSFFSTLQI
ncbi:PREDICTED: EF-hand calcium-binding domain-containing protein 1-like isoform X1 [Bactrocera latifrons]|nr:PREDICTED: EF-hand calcium-binding domain-containing protein 1-like isoform X1 [Bactrocera latifrons]